MNTARPRARPSRWIALAVGVIAVALFSAEAHDQKESDPWSGPGHVGDPLLPEDGRVLEFAAENVALLSWLSPEDIVGVAETANDVWGYVSPSGREYAILGLRSGTAFIEVTDPINPKVVKLIRGRRSTWRDMAVYGEYAYSVTEGGGGMQVIDLRKIDRGRVRIVRRVRDQGLTTAHNITINPASGYAYLSGSNLAGGGLVAVDLSDPARPRVERTAWPDHYVHDALAVSYTEGELAGREIVYGFAAETGLAIIDVTDKSDPFTIGIHEYPGLGYCHSGAIDRKLRYLYVNDELDELEGSVEASTTYIFNIKDVRNARFVRSVSTGKETIDHNSTVRGKWLYQANYESGLQVFDVKKPGRPDRRAFFDTFPDDDHAGFNGAWGVFADFPSGIVLISDIQRGLFVLQPPG